MQASRGIEGNAIPMSQRRRRLVCAFKEIEQHSSRRRRLPHIVVHQQEFVQAGVIKGGRRPHGLRGIPLWFRSGIRVKSRSIDSCARPEASARAFVGVSFARHSICPRALGGWTAGEAGGREIEAAPKKVHGTGLAGAADAKFLQNGISLEKTPPAAVP